MAEKLRYHPLVAGDISTAMDWYDGRSAGLGARFRSAVDARFDDIVESPERFACAFGRTDFRFAKTRAFPYIVLFRVKREGVYVLGLFHVASDPGKWRLRAHGA
jgi:hypothetical protein